MPTYEYRCPDGHRFEKFQKMTEKPKAKCPVCGKAAERMISGGAGLVFKGSGFYITDYGKDGKGPRKPVVESSGSETKSETKSESKPETKKESKPAATESKPSRKSSE